MGTHKLGSVVSADLKLNPFQLVLVGASRACQLMRGSRPMIETAANHPTSIVLEEFAAGLLQAERVEGEVTPQPQTTESDRATE
jgi:DNA-directed RNA polymerase omega subunit